MNRLLIKVYLSVRVYSHSECAGYMELETEKFCVPLLMEYFLWYCCLLCVVACDHICA